MIISVVNEKGGVGKTTTVLSLSTALAEKNKKVLILDLDPQSNATMGLGITSYTLSLMNVLRGEYSIEYVKQPTCVPGVDCVPSVSELRKADIEFSDRFLHLLLKKAITDISGYDYILIDTSPHLGLLSQSAIIASEMVIIPIEPCDASIKAYGDVLASIKNANLAGYSPRVFTLLTRLSLKSKKKNLEYQEHLRQESTETFKTCIRETILFKDAFRSSKPIFFLPRGKNSAGANDYRSLAKEVIRVSENSKSTQHQTAVSRKK